MIHPKKHAKPGRLSQKRPRSQVLGLLDENERGITSAYEALIFRTPFAAGATNV